MVSLEQVKLLETKVTRTIEYVKKTTEENSRLKVKLDSYQKRIDELEILIQRFREDQSRIEDGILSALDRLNQFEDALESTLTGGEARLSEASPEGKLSPKKETASATSQPDEEPEPLLELDGYSGENDSGSAKAADRESGGELDIF